MHIFEYVLIVVIIAEFSYEQNIHPEHKRRHCQALQTADIMEHVLPEIRRFLHEEIENIRRVEIADIVKQALPEIRQAIQEESEKNRVRCEQGWKYYDGNCYLFSDAVRCEQGWKYYDGNCYLFSDAVRCEQGWKYYDGNCYLFSDAVRCEQGWKYYDGNCYLFSSPEVSTWQGAKQICKNKNAYLVEIKSNDENSFIKKELTKLHAGDSYSVRYYLGGYLNSSVWTWDRSGEPFGYANWIPGEPSNHGGLEHCLEMLKSYNYEWNYYICSENVHFICKKMQST